jgi:hypothetical protein
MWKRDQFPKLLKSEQSIKPIEGVTSFRQGFADVNIDKRWTVQRWLKNVGDRVEKGEHICDLSHYPLGKPSEKARLHSPVSGTLILLNRSSGEHSPIAIIKLNEPATNSAPSKGDTEVAAKPVVTPRPAAREPERPEVTNPAASKRLSDVAATPIVAPPSAARQPTRPEIFLCYRRDDTEDATHRLHRDLIDTFGSHAVFIDIDSVPLGIDFVEHVQTQLTSCRAVVVMIGKSWLDIRDQRGKRRLENPGDHVRAEIAAALKLQVPVIPVFVQNSSMPLADELPEDIRSLARRNGIQLSAARWKTDIERLISELRRCTDR